MTSEGTRDTRGSFELDIMLIRQDLVVGNERGLMRTAVHILMYPSTCLSCSTCSSTCSYNAVLNSDPPIHPAPSLLFSTYYTSPTDTSIKIILRIALSGDPEESLQPRLQGTVGDCYNEPSHWLQGTLPLPHLRPASVD